MSLKFQPNDGKSSLFSAIDAGYILIASSSRVLIAGCCGAGIRTIPTRLIECEIVGVVVVVVVL